MYLEIIEILLRGFCVGVAASITVGPVAVLCIQRTLSKSRRSGIVSGLGVAAADTTMAMIAYFCYSMLQAQIDQYNQLLRVIAGIFVVIVGVYIFFQNPVPQIRRNRAGKTSLTQDFASIFGLTIANFVLVIPYILTFFAVFKISTIETFDVAGVSDGALTFVGAKNKPAFAGGVRFGCQPGLFVELVIDPVPSGEYPYSQCENQYKENGKDDTSDARSSFWHGSRRWRGWNRSERRGDGG